MKDNIGQEDRLTRRELLIAHQALNEVLNGVDLGSEFGTRMGASREEAKAIMNKLDLILESKKEN